MTEGSSPTATRSRRSWIPKPLLVTLFGAAVSAWLIPAFTRQWQDRQKEREIKVALVGAIGDATSDALATSQFVAAQAFPRGGQAEYTRLSLDWTRRTAEIEARLAAYFPGKPVVQRWHDYSHAVEDGFYLVTRDRGPRKQRALRRVKAYIGPAMEVRWSLFQPSMHYNDPRALDDYLVVSQELLDRKDPLIQAILDSHAEGFSTTGGDLVHDLLPFT